MKKSILFGGAFLLFASLIVASQASAAYLTQPPITTAPVWAKQGNDIYNTNSGNIGIGTATPQDKLEIKNGNILLSGVMSQGIILGGLNTSRNFRVDYYDMPVNGQASFDLFPSTQTTGYKDFNIYESNGKSPMVAIRLSANRDSYFNGGNIGIGNISPNYKLDVSGSIHGLSYYANDGTVGISTIINTRKADNSEACAITVKNGLITASTCQ